METKEIRYSSPTLETVVEQLQTDKSIRAKEQLMIVQKLTNTSLGRCERSQRSQEVAVKPTPR